MNNPLRTVPQADVTSPRPARKLQRIIIEMSPAQVTVLKRLWLDPAWNKHPKSVTEDVILASALTAAQQTALDNIINKMAQL